MGLGEQGFLRSWSRAREIKIHGEDILAGTPIAAKVESRKLVWLPSHRTPDSQDLKPNLQLNRILRHLSANNLPAPGSRDRFGRWAPGIVKSRSTRTMSRFSDSRSELDGSVFALVLRTELVVKWQEARGTWLISNNCVMPIYLLAFKPIGH